MGHVVVYLFHNFNDIAENDRKVSVKKFFKEFPHKDEVEWANLYGCHLLAFSQNRSQCILGLFGGTKNTVVDVKYVRIEIYTIKYQLFT